VHFFVSVIAGLAVGLAWVAIWAWALHASGIPVFKPQPEDRARRRERIKQMGKLRYIVLFGVLGFGLPLGLGVTTAQLMFHDIRGWASALMNILLFSVLGGWLHGAMNWSGAVGESVPFPPEFPPTKR
jgi:hypothetical protein